MKALALLWPSYREPTLRTVLAALLLALFAVAPIHPAKAVVVGDTFPPTILIKCYADSTAYTNATTSYTDLSAATCAFTPFRNDPTTAGNTTIPAKADFIRVTAYLRVSKATAGTGTCGIFVNGAIVTATERLTDFGEINAEMTLGYIVPNTVVGAQTVKIQCKSSDANTLTVTAGSHLIVEEIVRY